MRSNNNIIEAKLAAYIQTECLPGSNTLDLGYDTNLFEAGIVDSAGLISYICYIEKEFNIEIPDEDLLPENFVSIARIAHYIRSHQQVDHVYSEEMHRLGS